MLEGKVAVITGGSRGIGRAIATKFASLGADIAILYLGNEAEAKLTKLNIETSYKVKVKIYKANISSFEDTKKVVNQIKADFTTIHFLVNNAGITRDGLVLTMEESDFDEVIATNLKGAFNMIKHCSSLFLRNKEGSIINISSVVGLMGNVGQCNYAASKAGLIGLTKTIAKELASRGIRCNAIAPGFIATDMTKQLENPEILKNIPLGRKGNATEIAEATVFLATAQYITGVVLRVDGGLAM
ncbi:MAG: 3-oxoacyl-ACP reductase FabG [Spirochaetales bacterium]|nr:3-oxoacyl-ACP reductase FabG [Spirochaetales bacterium]